MVAVDPWNCSSPIQCRLLTWEDNRQMIFGDRSSSYLRFASFNKIVQIDRRDLIFTSTIEPFRQQTLAGRWPMTWESEKRLLPISTSISVNLTWLLARISFEWDSLLPERYAETGSPGSWNRYWEYLHMFALRFRREMAKGRTRACTSPHRPTWNHRMTNWSKEPISSLPDIGFIMHRNIAFDQFRCCELDISDQTMLIFHRR